jgi:hypothetical protein
VEVAMGRRGRREQAGTDWGGAATGAHSTAGAQLVIFWTNAGCRLFALQRCSTGTGTRRVGDGEEGRSRSCCRKRRGFQEVSVASASWFAGGRAAASGRTEGVARGVVRRGLEVGTWDDGRRG